jgi:hypothetical protein
MRVSLAKPRPERLAEVRRHYEELVSYLSKFPGFIEGWVIDSSAGEGETGRMTMWQTEADADHAANDPHVLALQSELRFDLMGQPWDRAFESHKPVAG